MANLSGSTLSCSKPSPEWQVEVEFVPLAAGEQLQNLRSGTVDLLAAGLQHTKGQEADLDFSQTYLPAGPAC
ncbi:MAG: transporter substrate-binding domain-containing protein [Caldilineaceae bacterium]